MVHVSKAFTWWKKGKGEDFDDSIRSANNSYGVQKTLAL